MAVEQFEKSNGEGTAPIRPKAHLDSCLNCSGSGLVAAISPPIPDTENYPHVAIIGGGIGGVALAVACLHRGIPPFTNAITASARSQGYGLTLQQAKAIRLGVFSLEGK
jgi:NADPH-dependent 2,4-dienoyl-CoA reductase/sulfur reductase-like enzyme